MKTLTTLFKNNIRQYGMLIALIVVMLFFQVATNGILFKVVNITNLCCKTVMSLPWRWACCWSLSRAGLIYRWSGCRRGWRTGGRTDRQI